MSGFVFTANGWVQSYGSRCVKPPVLFGDVERPQPMTMRWSQFAQAQAHKPMKGMLTGPITILQWSFVRDDQSRAATARQLALAIRDEVRDLEAAGISIIQVDEPALREGLPLRREDWAAYLRWSVDAFRLATAGVADRTQIHTHMCYCEFNEILAAIAELDADVHFDRKLPVGNGAVGGVPHVPVSQRSRTGRLGYPFAARALDWGNGLAVAKGAAGPAPPTALGEPRLRPQDPRLARKWSNRW